ncbi:MAG TPA: preprotein translocase subunit SecY [Candidatus Paceibacterota bacterium]|nr:preprotein translocase subunit SecY [Candidatus Paceibacterota bacterium]
MQTVLSKLKILFTERQLRNRLLFVLAALFMFRLLASIPLPGIDETKLNEFLFGNQLVGLFNLFSGGGLSNLSIVLLGVGPYITASIIMQLLTMMFPNLKELYHESGEMGRKKFNNYTRLLTIPLAALQAFSLLVLFKRQGVFPDLTSFDMAVNICIAIAGSMLLMWIGELVTQFGIGNGVSLVIFAGIVAALPSSVSQFFFTFTASQLPTLILFVAVGLLVIAGVILVTEAERPIPVTYARQVRVAGLTTKNANGTYLPLRLNHAGVIPIIFALSILLFPQLIANLLQASANGTLQSIASGITAFLQNTWAYAATYFVLVVLFTYFYTAVTFDPKQIATNLQKSGAFVPGIRPGESTTQYLGSIVSRITIVGALFLGLIAVLPLIARAVTGISALTLGGTALLIVVSVIIDISRKLDAQIAMHEY